MFQKNRVTLTAQLVETKKKLEQSEVLVRAFLGQMSAQLRGGTEGFEWMQCSEISEELRQVGGCARTIVSATDDIKNCKVDGTLPTDE